MHLAAALVISLLIAKCASVGPQLPERIRDLELKPGITSSCLNISTISDTMAL